MKRLMWCAGWVLCGASLTLAAPPAAPPAGNAPPTSDAEFVKKASEAGLAEVNFGRLALEQSTNSDVKAFAQHMVDDHSKANAELLKVADKDQLAPALKMDAQDQETFTKLSGLKGADFDREYVASQLAAHKDAIALFQAEAKDGKNADVKSFAEKTLPTLQHHLDMVTKLSGEEKTPAKDKTTAKDK